MDGGMTIGTAYQRVPYGEFGEQLYGQTHPDDRGLLFITPEKLLDIFRRGVAEGMATDGALPGRRRGGVFLDALEALNQSSPLRRRART